MDNIDDRVGAIFQSALRITDPEARDRYVTDSCGGDNAMEQRIKALLIVTSENTSTMETAAVEPRTVDFVFDDSERVGSIIGPYELIGLIGSGGMGLVFLAQQNLPVRRQVALKIIRPGMDDREGIRRFKAERQTLAHLNHPGIARLLDAGTTSTRRPWFVMELAQGLPITDFCQKNKLPLIERLRLFELVCDAVDHVHQHGVLHRDLKPANIVVTQLGGRYVPKVIDFGVARVSPEDKERQRQGKNSSPSQPDVILGTPAYMSPEQTYMPDSDLDARSDVYALGILLYKLLTDVNPFHGTPWREMDYLETRRTIHEVTPSAPSERIQTYARQKDSTTSSKQNESENVDDHQNLRTVAEWRRLSAELRGDLDWITLKAIEKNRTHRYGSVKELTADIERHLRHEPVEAGPRSRVYRFRKFLRRRTTRLVFLTLTLCLMLLLSLFLIIGRMLLYEREESEKFRQQVRDGHELIQVRDKIIHNQNYVTEMQTGFTAYFRGNTDRARDCVQQFSVGSESHAVVGFEWHYLNKLCHDSPNILTGDSGKVFCVRFSPDGRLMACCNWSESGSGSLQIRNAKTGALLQSIRGFNSDVNAACFNSDATIVLTSDDSGRVCIWDTQTGDLKGQLDDFEYGLSQIFLASDDRTLIASEVDWGPLKSKTSVWDLKTLTRSLRIEQLRMLDVSESLGIVATTSNDGEISLRNFPDLNVVLTFPGKHTSTDCGRLSHDGKTLVTGSKLGTVRIWNRDTSDSLVLFEPPPHAAAIRDLGFSSDDQLLFIALSDGIVQIWNTATRTLQRVLNTNMGDAWSVDVSPDGKEFAVGFTRGRVELREIASMGSLKRAVYQATSPFSGIAHDTKGERIAIVDSVGATVSVIATGDGTILNSIHAPEGVILRSAAFSADDEGLWTTDAAGKLFKVGLETADVVEQSFVLNQLLDTPIVSRDGKYVGFNGIQPNDRIATVWDTQSNSELFRIPLKASTDGSRVPAIIGFLDDMTVIAKSGRSLSQWDCRTGQKILPEFPEQPYWIAAAAFSPDNKTLLIGLENSDVFFVDLASRKSVGMLQGVKEVLGAIAFSFDGRTAATATESGRIQLWHVSTRQPIYELPRIDGKILSLWFTADGTRLLAAIQSASGSGEIVVWDATKEQ
jgi:serine/threonine protein kinase/WD40 repeat protein